MPACSVRDGPTEAWKAPDSRANARLPGMLRSERAARAWGAAIGGRHLTSPAASPRLRRFPIMARVPRLARRTRTRPGRRDETDRPVMKIRNSIKQLRKRHRDNRVVRRRGRLYVINKTMRRYKARQG